LPGAPIRALRAFRRIRLAAGATQTVTFEVSPRNLSYVNEAGDRVVTAADYRITVGGGQPDTGAPFAEATLRIHGEQKFPE